MKFKEFEKKTEQELLDLINDLRAELFTLRFKNKTQQQDQTHKIKLVRRDIAKALTALKQQKGSDNNAKVVKSVGIKKSKTEVRKTTNTKKEKNNGRTIKH